MSKVTTPSPRKSLDAKTIGLMIVPLILLVGVIILFLTTNGAGLHVEPAAPVESITFDKTILRPDEIEVHIRNTSPQPITISTVNINDAIWTFTAQPSPTLPRFEEPATNPGQHACKPEGEQLDAQDGRGEQRQRDPR